MEISLAENFSEDKDFETVIKKEDFDTNPWSVDDATAFLKYCCPECNYHDGDLKVFSNHALENHERSSILFNTKSNGYQMVPKVESDNEINDYQEHDYLENDYDSDPNWELPLKKFKNLGQKSSVKVESDLLDPQEYVSTELETGTPNQICCEICVLDFPNLEILDMHNSEKHEDAEGMKQCHLCDNKLKTFNGLKAHIDSKHSDHGEKKYFCKKCDESFIFQSSLRIHKGKHKIKQEKGKQKQVTKRCEICVHEFSTYKLLTAHNRQKHESGRCHHCNHKTGSLSNLKIHIDTNHPEHGEKKFFCEQCDKGFIFNTTLSQHKTWKHRGNKVCEICGKELSVGNLANHMLLQHGVRPKDTIDVVCEICGFSTPSKKSLHSHKLIQHQVEKHKQCPHCDFRAPSKQKVNIHIDRNHPDSSEHQFFCELCGKGYIYKDTLNHHVIYMCKNSKSLKKIKQSYKPRTPLNIPCGYCDQIFKHSKNAKIHYKTFHPNLPISFENGLSKYSCSECQDFFFTETELYNHTDVKHRKKKIRGVKAGFTLQCDYCDEVLTGTKRAKLHYQNWHPNQAIIAEGHAKYQCYECPDFFFLQDELDCHLNLDHGVKTEKNYCRDCHHSYKDLHKCFKGVRYAQKKIDKVPCPHCDRLFSSTTNMRSHVKSVHEKILDFECGQCGKKLASKKTLDNHIVQSHNQVTCELCHKKVATKTDLRKHKVFVHNDTKGAWLCERCPKTVFFMKSMFEKHMKNKH